MSAPHLRFNTFNNKWKLHSLGALANRVTSGSRDWAKYYSKSGGKFIRMTNLSRGGIDLKLDDLKFVDIKSSSTDGKRTSLIEGDILLSITAELGKIGWVPSGLGKAFINQHTALLRLKTNAANSKFIAHLLSTSKCNKHINRLNDAGAKAGLNLSTIKSIQISLPELKEQTKIANFLTAVDEKITQLTQKADLLAQYKKGVMQQIFSQELRFKDDDGQDFPEWEERRLNQLALINPKSRELPDEFIYIDLESVEKGILLKEDWVAYEDAPSRAQRFLTRNDILFQMVRPYQRNNLFFNRVGYYVASTGYAQLRTNQEPKFLYYCLHEDGFIAEVMSRCTGTSYPAIKSSDLGDIELNVPTSLIEQTKIANFLTAIDDKIHHTKTQLEATKRYKKGLLQQMFV